MTHIISSDMSTSPPRRFPLHFAHLTTSILAVDQSDVLEIGRIGSALFGFELFGQTKGLGLSAVENRDEQSVRRRRNQILNEDRRFGVGFPPNTSFPIRSTEQPEESVYAKKKFQKT